MPPNYPSVKPRKISLTHSDHMSMKLCIFRMRIYFTGYDSVHIAPHCPAKTGPVMMHYPLMDGTHGSGVVLCARGCDEAAPSPSVLLRSTQICNRGISLRCANACGVSVSRMGSISPTAPLQPSSSAHRSYILDGHVISNPANSHVVFGIGRLWPPEFQVDLRAQFFSRGVEIQGV